MDTQEFASRIDETLLSKDAPADRYTRLAEEVEEVGANVCVPPTQVETVSEVSGEIAAVVGFPQGTHLTETKIHEARTVVQKGATEVDLAADVSALKSGEDERFVEDVSRVADLDITTKCIIETGMLTDEEKRRAARLSVEAGADYVKTCTGFAPGEATVEDVRLIAEEVGSDADIKASGGVRTAEQALRLMEEGASRIGSSSGIELIREYAEEFD